MFVGLYKTEQDLSPPWPGCFSWRCRHLFPASHAAHQHRSPSGYPTEGIFLHSEKLDGERERERETGKNILISQNIVIFQKLFRSTGFDAAE